MAYEPIRKYVFAVAEDKRLSLLITIRDQLSEELVDNKDVDLTSVFCDYMNMFIKIDELVTEYAIDAAHSGGERDKALETVMKILEVDV